MDPVLSGTDEQITCGRNGATIVFIIISAVTFALTTILIPFRLYVRLSILRAFWWDDVSILVAYLLMVPYFALVWRMVDLGLGYRVECVPYENVQRFIELEVVTEFLQIVCTMFSRVSVALFVGRLFGVTESFRWLLYGYTMFMCISMIVTAILTVTVCYPVKYIWHVQPGSPGDCSATAGMRFRDWYNGIVGILSDMILALIPAYFLSKLQLCLKTRITLCLLMAIGLVPAGLCLVRTVVMSQVDNYQPLASFAKVAVFGGNEASILIICAIIPTLRPMLLRDNHFSAFFRRQSRKLPTLLPKSSQTNSSPGSADNSRHTTTTSERPRMARIRTDSSETSTGHSSSLTLVTEPPTFRESH